MLIARQTSLQRVVVREIPVVQSQPNLLFLILGGICLLVGLSVIASRGMFTTCTLDRDSNQATLYHLGITKWKRSTVALDEITDDHRNGRIAPVVHQGHWREFLSPIHHSDHDDRQAAARLMREFLKA